MSSEFCYLIEREQVAEEYAKITHDPARHLLSIQPVSMSASKYIVRWRPA